jgi:very-short-patch-repair endonuclease
MASKRNLEGIKNDLNSLFLVNNKKAKIETLTKEELIFENGYSVKYPFIKKFILRFEKSQFKEVWIDNIDDLISGDITDDEIISINRRTSAKEYFSNNTDEVLNNLSKNRKIPENVFKKNNIPWNKGRTKETCSIVNKMSEDRMGDKNPVHTLTPDQLKSMGKKVSIAMKNKILSGDYTPKTNNRLSRKDNMFAGDKYRSSWEVIFKCNHPDFEYEKLRLEYSEGIYIVDFICTKTNTVVEIKPKRLFDEEKNILKLNALNEWASKNNYNVMILTEENIFELSEPNIDQYEKMDARTQQLIRDAYENYIKKKNR